MSLPLILGCVWVLAATLTALMPLRLQYPPGLTLLILAPPLLIWIGAAHGWLITVAAAVAFVSMFRYPLRYLAKRALGLPAQPPRGDGMQDKEADR